MGGWGERGVTRGCTPPRQESKGLGRMRPGRARLKEPMHLLAAAARVGGGRGNIVRAARGRSEDGLATGENRECTLTKRSSCKRGCPGALLAAVARPVARLATLKADTLRWAGDRGVSGGRGSRLGGRRGRGCKGKLLEDRPHILGQGGGCGRRVGWHQRGFGAKGMEEGLTQGMDPWRGGGSGQELKQIGFRERWG